MPFLRGRSPVRRTLQYLEAGKLIFQPEIRIMTINYNVNQKSSSGAYDFQFWHFPQIKFKNPHIQLYKFKNMTPTPCIQFLFFDQEKIVVDVFGKTREEIHDHLQKTFCESEGRIETLKSVQEWNPGAFGYRCNHWCMCEFPGQVPCPGFVPTPKHRQGKYIYSKKEN